MGFFKCKNDSNKNIVINLKHIVQIVEEENLFTITLTTRDNISILKENKEQIDMFFNAIGVPLNEE